MGDQNSLREAARPRNQLVKQLTVPPLNQLTDLFLPRIPSPNITNANTSYTRVFIPRDFLRGLFGVYGLDLPTQFTEPTDQDKDTAILSNIDPSTISYLGEFSSATLAVFVSNSSTTVSVWNLQAIEFNTTVPYAVGDEGWTTIETVLVQLDTSLTPSGRFPVYSNTEEKVRVGFDATVCVQRYEPWIIEAYNASTGSPSVLRVVGKGDGSHPPLPSGNIQGNPTTSTRYLNTTGKGAAFLLAHDNSWTRMSSVKFSQDEEWYNYIPPPLVGPVVSYAQRFF